MHTVLVVDESPANRAAVALVLAKAGYIVEQACNSSEALARFESGQKIDLLVTELGGPGSKGFEFIRTVRRLPGYQTLPILFLTETLPSMSRAMPALCGA